MPDPLILSYMKHWLGQKGWRMLHYASFALFVIAIAHGVVAGTDSGEIWVQLFYLGSGLTVLFLTFFRILAARNQGKLTRAAKPAACAETVNATHRAV